MENSENKYCAYYYMGTRDSKCTNQCQGCENLQKQSEINQLEVVDAEEVKPYIFINQNFKVLDLETSTVHDLVSIDMREKRVVMYAEESGHCGNDLNKTKIIVESENNSYTDKTRRILLEKSLDRRGYKNETLIQEILNIFK